MSASADEVLETLRADDPPAVALGGFGPLIAAAVLLVAMMLLLPSTAPEEEGERPVTQLDTVERSG